MAEMPGRYIDGSLKYLAQEGGVLKCGRTLNELNLIVMMEGVKG